MRGAKRNFAQKRFKKEIMNNILKLVIEEHDKNKCSCDCTDEGHGLCMAGQFLDFIITEKEFLDEIGEFEITT